MAVEVRGLSYRYGEVEALRSVSFTIERGAKVALMGPNGAGKSTLISLLNGLGTICNRCWKACIGWAAKRPSPERSGRRRN